MIHKIVQCAWTCCTCNVAYVWWMCYKVDATSFSVRWRFLWERVLFFIALSLGLHIARSASPWPSPWQSPWQSLSSPLPSSLSLWKVSWVRVDEASPFLLSVGQFVFTGDQRISVWIKQKEQNRILVLPPKVTQSPSANRWSLAIVVSFEGSVALLKLHKYFLLVSFICCSSPSPAGWHLYFFLFYAFVCLLFC